MVKIYNTSNHAENLIIIRNMETVYVLIVSSVPVFGGLFML